jgi:hypothetical protein
VIGFIGAGLFSGRLFFKSINRSRMNKNIKVGDKVTFDTDQVETFKHETSSQDKSVQEYRNLVLAGINEIGTVKEVGLSLTTVSFADGWELPIPTKYLIVLPSAED